VVCPHTIKVVTPLRRCLLNDEFLHGSQSQTNHQKNCQPQQREKQQQQELPAIHGSRSPLRRMHRRHTSIPKSRKRSRPPPPQKRGPNCRNRQQTRKIRTNPRTLQPRLPPRAKECRKGPRAERLPVETQGEQRYTLDQ